MFISVTRFVCSHSSLLSLLAKTQTKQIRMLTSALEEQCNYNPNNMAFLYTECPQIEQVQPTVEEAWICTPRSKRFRLSKRKCRKQRVRDHPSWEGRPAWLIRHELCVARQRDSLASTIDESKSMLPLGRGGQKVTQVFSKGKGKAKVSLAAVGIWRRKRVFLVKKLYGRVVFGTKKLGGK